MWENFRECEIKVWKILFRFDNKYTVIDWTVGDTEEKQQDKNMCSSYDFH